MYGYARPGLASKKVKEDMGSDRPMDRLVCGDVGFGKTEVAIRAAFKAVCDSKQVAVLVPTTILALQHYHTFSSRLKVSLQGRIYKSSSQYKRDIAYIGGPRVRQSGHSYRYSPHPQQKVLFKDLGLLIIDEEQNLESPQKRKYVR